MPSATALEGWFDEARVKYRALLAKQNTATLMRPNRLAGRLETLLSVLRVPWDVPRDLQGHGRSWSWVVRSNNYDLVLTLSESEPGEPPELFITHFVASVPLTASASELRRILQLNGEASGGARFALLTTGNDPLSLDLVASSILPASGMDEVELMFAIRGVLGLLDDYSLRTPAGKEPERAASFEVAGVADPSLKIAEDHLANRATDEVEEPDANVLLARLHDLIGLTAVKERVESISNLLAIQKRRRDSGLKESEMSHHLVFTGPPGTGKTTVARLLAQIYRAVGLLESGHLVEAARQDLVASYVGQTAIKTNELVDRALGGVLFIDEAYTLSPGAAVGGGHDFGSEAIATLLKRMEDDRGRFVVIVAGYEDEMNRFLESNPGLRSRFNQPVMFPNYSAEELVRILELFVADNDYMLDPRAGEVAEVALHEAEAAAARNFGNARAVRNYFEAAVSAQANRLVTVTDPGRLELSLLSPEDLTAAREALGLQP